MKLKQSKPFFNYIFDKNTPKEQIRFILCNPALTHLKSIIEVVYNLLENNFIKIPLSVKRKIKQYKQFINHFVDLKEKKKLRLAKKVLRKHYRLFFFLLYNSRKLISQVLDQ